MTALAFYAPLKAPDDPVPSGDRTVARLLLAALAQAGFAPRVESGLRTRDAAGGGHAALREASLTEAARILREVAARPPAARPRLWFTYHVYYKAPDWIGPAVARALAIPYVVAEGSRAGKRAAGPHALGHGGAEAALDAADLVLAMTARDREALARARPAHQALLDLPPFTDAAPALLQLPRSGGPPRLLAVGMMRSGDKLASYRLLAEALGRLDALAWRLDVVGDGPERAAVEALFAPSRTRFHGRLDGAALAALYSRADLLVWPAVNEAFGMALLEAQAHGCPVVAGGDGGVREVVRDGITGLVTPPGDVAALAAAVAGLLADGRRRRAMAAAARAFVAEERGVAAAAGRLRAALQPLLRARDAA